MNTSLKLLVSLGIMLAGSAGAATVARNAAWLDRGLYAVNTSGSNVYLSWRLLGNDAASTVFNIYRNGTRIATTAAGAPSNYIDASGSAGARYSVKAVVGGSEQPADTSGATALSHAWLSIPLTRPAGGTLNDSAYTYSPNDASAADLDGDGQLEIVLKWDPSNSKDNSQSGYTGDVYLDAYKLNGKRLWRIDLGPNIRAGAHYTQFLVADFDGDGKAEVMCKTSAGTKDGSGAYLSNGPAASDTDSRDYRNSKGYVLTGPEYLTVFNGTTGREMATVNYVPGRGTVSGWGDSYGNRVDRFLATIAWLGNGSKPSAVFQRGYYTRMDVVAWDWNGTSLTKRWDYNAATSGSGCYGQGNHNLSAADVDFDGYDEIIEGACAINNDGSFMYRTGYGHGDAMHVGKMLPTNDTLMVWEVHEDQTTYAEELHNALTGKVYWYHSYSDDNGRGLAADVDSTSPGYEMWSMVGTMRSPTGATVYAGRPSVNFRIYWDGDLQDEILDGTKLDKWTGSGTTRLMTFYNYPNTSNGAVANNTTKANPSLVADLLGDWREEAVFPTANSDSLIIFSTTTWTPHRMYTLMHDPEYRDAISWQNTAYNQPPHLSFLLSDTAKWPKPSLTLLNAPAVAANTAPVFTSAKSFTLAENTQYVTTVTASDADGDAVTYAITGGEDSASFIMNGAKGTLYFRRAPDYEAPKDADTNNIYKLEVTATDGKLSTVQSIAVMVTDTNEATTGLRISRNFVNARVVWMGADGKVIARENVMVDPKHPSLTPPAGVRGLSFARISAAGMTPRTLRIPGL